MVLVVVTIALILSIEHAETALPLPSGNSHVYDALPVQERNEFSKALENLLTLEKRGDWSQVYGLLDKEQAFNGQKQVSLEKFIRKTRTVRLMDFTVSGVYYIPPEGVWQVVGCGKFSKLPPFAARHREGVVSSFSARRISEGWRFGAPPTIQLDKDSGGTKGCTIP